MARGLLIAAILLFFSPSLAQARDYTVEEIDVICSKQAKFTENVAIARDAKYPEDQMLAGLDNLLKEKLITKQLHRQAITITKWVYKYPVITPDEMAFMWKDGCVDQLLEKETI